MGLMKEIFAGPPWLVAWVCWLMIVNMGSIAFVKDRIEARWVLAAFMAAAIIMTVLFEMSGFTRLLGLAHILGWTPALVYLWTRRASINLSTPFGKWILILVVTNVTSLAVDFIDVVRYVLGDGGLS